MVCSLFGKYTHTISNLSLSLSQFLVKEAGSASLKSHIDRALCYAQSVCLQLAAGQYIYGCCPMYFFPLLIVNVRFTVRPDHRYVLFNAILVPVHGNLKNWLQCWIVPVQHQLVWPADEYESRLSHASTEGQRQCNVAICQYKLWSKLIDILTLMCFARAQLTFQTCPLGPGIILYWFCSD